jgi:hypothetical protein
MSIKLLEIVDNKDLAQLERYKRFKNVSPSAKQKWHAVTKAPNSGFEASDYL